MPNPLTHFLFADDLIGAIRGESAREIIRTAPDAFRLGALGPDYLFILRELKLADKRFATRMHTEKCVETMNALCRAKDAAGRAYALGFSTHYVLDSSLHPYVFYEALNIEKNASAGEELSCFAHSLIECAVDGEFLKTHPEREKFASRSKTRRTLSRFIRDNVNPLYDEKLSARRIAFAFKTTEKLAGLTENASGKVKIRAKRIEDLFFKSRRRFSVMIQPPDADEKLDVLNTARRPFPSVRGGSANRVMSVSEIIVGATKKALDFIDKVMAAFDGKYEFTLRDMPLDYEGNLIA